MFQYWEETMGMELNSRYLFNWSSVAVLPALRQLVTDAPGLPLNRADAI